MPRVTSAKLGPSWQCLPNSHKGLSGLPDSCSPPRLFRERLSQLRLRLEEVGAERAPEYTEPLGGLQRSLKIRIQVAGPWLACALLPSQNLQLQPLPLLSLPSLGLSSRMCYPPFWAQAPSRAVRPPPPCRNLQGLLSGCD